MATGIIWWKPKLGNSNQIFFYHLLKCELQPTDLHAFEMPAINAFKEALNVLLTVGKLQSQQFLQAHCPNTGAEAYCGNVQLMIHHGQPCEHGKPSGSESNLTKYPHLL